MSCTPHVDMKTHLVSYSYQACKNDHHVTKTVNSIVTLAFPFAKEISEVQMKLNLTCYIRGSSDSPKTTGRAGEHDMMDPL